jgi:hypothetical protein
MIVRWRSGVISLAACLAAGAGGALADMPPGARGDGIVDLHVGGGDLILRTDGVVINGFILTSDAALLSGDPYVVPAGLFLTDADHEIADQFDYVLGGLHDLGRVVASGVAFEKLQEDLTLTYTVQDQSGIYAATILPAISGDADLDGKVGHRDLVTLRESFGTSAGAVWVDADFTGDGAVDFLDYVTQKRRAGVAGAPAPAVPEPATAALLSLGGLALARGTRRRGRCALRAGMSAKGDRP